MRIMAIQFTDAQRFARDAAKEHVAISDTKNTDWYGYSLSPAGVVPLLVGVMGLMEVPGGGLRIKGVYVMPAHRGKGIGEKLVDVAISRADVECNSFLEALAYNWRFYERKGFKKSGLLRANGAQMMRRKF